MTTVNTQQLYQFIQKKVGNTLNQKEALKLGLEKEYTEASLVLEVDEIDIDDIIEDKDLYAQFATLYVEDKEKTQSAKDEEKEKEEQNKVQEKNEAGI
jgi:hypothetical protein